MFGRVRGKSIELESELPSLDGKRVKIVIELVEDLEALDSLLSAAPLDDRPMTDEERKAIAEVREERARLIPHEEVRAKIDARKNG